MRQSNHQIIPAWAHLGLIVLLFALLLGFNAADPVFSQEPDEAETGTEALQVVDESILPVLFDDDFEDAIIDPDIWAYDIRESELVDENEEGTNAVMQLGHDLQWSEVILLEGSEWRNYIVEVDVRLLVYVDGADNFFLGVRYDPELGEYAASLDLARRQVTLSNTEDDIWQGVSSQAPLVLDLQTWYRLKIHVEGSQLRFYVNDDLAAEATGGDLEKGSIRLLTAPGSYAQVDNVVVKEIPSPAEEGDLLVTEFMFRDNSMQWFEVFNDSGRHIELTDLVITNGSERYVIEEDQLLLPPQSYMTFTSEQTGFDFQTDAMNYFYGDALHFPADNGYLALRFGGETVTEISYSEDTGWPLEDNLSVSLHPEYYTRRRQDNGYNWCQPVQVMQETPLMRGTPGRPNHICRRELPLGDHETRQHGDLIITEIMANVDGPDEGYEWFEVYNPSDSPVSMTGLTLATDKPSEIHTITGAVVVPPKGYLVLAQTGLSGSGLPPDLAAYQYPGNFKLSNEDGELSILDGGRAIDVVSYRDPENGWWPLRAGMSMTLHPAATSVYANDDALNWCLGWTEIAGNPSALGTPGAPNDPCPMWDINSPLVDVQSAYEDATLEPITFRITISQEDLDDMNANPFSDTVYPIHFAAGDDKPLDLANNANIRPRGGRGTRSANMLSYRVRLDEPFWGHRTIQLNKHLGDPTRLRNALAFRLFQDIDDMMSMRTQFVHVFLNGEDQGLYTMIESPSRPFLRNHRLDERGNLFKIGLPSGTSSFFYYGSSDRESRINSIRLTAQLEAGHDHDGLIDMIDAVYSTEDINTVIDRHFNRDNLLTYFSVLYLVQNRDTRVQNYMLYSTPREPHRVYFFPWDWDSGFRVRNGSTVFGGRWREGLGNWAGMGILDRLVREPELVDALIFRMLELTQTSLSPQSVNTMADNLAANVEPFTRQAPEHFELSPSSLEVNVEEVKTVVPASARAFIDVIEWPLPPRADEVLYGDVEDTVKFVWLPAYDIQQDPVSYEIVLFDNRIWDENNIVWRTERTTRSSLTISAEDIPDEVTAGTYYWMVYAWDDENYYNTSQVGSLGEISTIVDLP